MTGYHCKMHFLKGSELITLPETFFIEINELKKGENTLLFSAMSSDI